MRRYALVIVALSVLILLPPWPSPSQADCIAYNNYVHALDVIYPAGYLRSMVYQAPYLYVVSDDSLLTILDAADPGALQVIGSLELPAQPRKIDIRGSVAYLVYAFSNQLQLVDISDPYTPQTLGSLLIPAGPQSVAATESYVYVPAWDYGEDNHGLYVVDVTKPLTPFVVGRVELNHYPRHVILSEPLAFAIDSGDLWVLDISTPQQPKPLGSIGIPGESAYLAARDEYVFVVCDAGEYPATGNGLYMINISDPADPWIEGVYDAEGAPSYHVGLWEQYAIVGTHGGGFAFIDISDPSNMHIVDTIGMQPNPGDFAVDGSILFARSYSIASYKLINPMTPAPVASVLETEQSRAITSQGDYAYTLRDRGLEFCVVDLSDSDHPFKIGSKILDLDSGGDVALTEQNRNGLFAYVAEGGDNDGFHVIDINDPADPEPVNFIPLDHYPSDFEVEGNYLYVMAGYLGLLTYDISDPVEPEYISSIGFGYSASMTKAVGSMLYVGRRVSNHSDLIIIDAADPYDPQIVGTSSEPETPCEYWIEETILYIADGWGGLLIMDISDPENPTPISRLRTGSNVQALVIENDVAYLADTAERSGLHLVDVSNPAIPSLVGYYPCSFPCDLELIHGHVLIATYNENLEVAPLECGGIIDVDDSQPAWAGFGMSIHPNPSFDRVSVRLVTPAKEMTRLTVHDVQGRLIDQLHWGPLAAGTHHFQWDGRRRDGRAMPVGVYYLRYLSGRLLKSQSIVLVR
ncbi:MAG: hypothetical protein KJ970_01415 [Candidatus Eisenbacteria bacterium]|uniref:FlgD/Vpr Ig-like domain-containing protein n=1 Tax=Eiseniibacteriota bacterium TaxID=2212470 RepID=A0A948W5G4_UNCEI|nr:hypothetical protein [Candidatus Eisenbacteria bacterium]MBU1949556.1 hypothetical protein [Candidatus Eisenbacteria bacterium]MBU2689561.1 hypothetical protein [Candidatus Eisenbacteria bacterium]